MTPDEHDNIHLSVSHRAALDCLQKRIKDVMLQMDVLMDANNEAGGDAMCHPCLVADCMGSFMTNMFIRLDPAFRPDAIKDLHALIEKLPEIVQVVDSVKMDGQSDHEAGNA